MVHHVDHVLFIYCIKNIIPKLVGVTRLEVCSRETTSSFAIQVGGLQSSNISWESKYLGHCCEVGAFSKIKISKNVIVGFQL